jgi:hypothetical protein
MDFVILTRKPIPIRLVRHTIPWDLDLNGDFSSISDEKPMLEVPLSTIVTLMSL